MDKEQDKPLDDFLENSKPTAPAPNIQADPASKKEDYNFKKKKREDDMDGNRHLVIICAIWGAAILFAAIVVVRVLHLILAVHCRWLSDADIQGVDKIIFSGAIGGAIGSYLDKAVKGKD